MTIDVPRICERREDDFLTSEYSKPSIVIADISSTKLYTEVAFPTSVGEMSVEITSQ
jgi:hypothetical protein